MLKKSLICVMLLMLALPVFSDDLIVSGRYVDAQKRGTGTWATGYGGGVEVRTPITGALSCKFGAEYVRYGLARQNQPGEVESFGPTLGLELALHTQKGVKVSVGVTPKYLFVVDKTRPSSQKVVVAFGGSIEYGDADKVRVLVSGGYQEQYLGSEVSDRDLFTGPYAKIGLVFPMK